MNDNETKVELKNDGDKIMSVILAAIVAVQTGTFASVFGACGRKAGCNVQILKAKA